MGTVTDRKTAVMKRTSLLWITLAPVLLLFLLPGPGPRPSVAYDGYSACPKQYRSSRHRAQLPCDFRQQSWCTVPGSAYPWHAVRRFVHENHGLMRRMYGDERHISVLRAEIESNDVELVREPAWQVEDDVKRRYSINNPHKPHFRPAHRNPPPPPSSTAPPSPSSSPPTTASTITSTAAPQTQSPSTTTFSTSTSTTTTSTTSTEASSSSTTVSVGRIHLQLHLVNTTLFTSTTTPGPASTHLDRHTTIPTTTDSGVDGDLDAVRAGAGLGILGATQQDDETTETVDTTLTPPVTTPTSKAESVSSAGTSPSPATSPVTAPSSSPTSSPSPPTTPSTQATVSTAPPSSTTEQDVQVDDLEDNGQETLFQDADADRTAGGGGGGAGPDAAQQPGKPATPLLKLRGMNACPVKEEVVAPFWANNTRGEVLALLNLYPFEQYVHWEKCTHEHKQMFCREGCRCEQQYRLHRLLAYDPNNECRGIFSDWFKFPSCCICRCYDLPAEFRFTSRSPRTPVLRERPAPAAPPHLAPADWYRVQAQAQAAGMAARNVNGG